MSSTLLDESSRHLDTVSGPPVSLLARFGGGRHLLALVLIAGVLLAWNAVVVGSAGKRAALFALTAPATLYLLGRCALGWLPLEDALRRSFAGRLILGFVLASLALLAFHHLFRWSMAWNWGLLVVLTALLAWRDPQHEDTEPTRRDSRMELLVVAFCLAIATGHNLRLLTSVRATDEMVRYSNFIDSFQHAAFVARFLHEVPLAGLGGYDLSGTPTPLYHYNSYPLTAALASVARQSAYDCVLALYIPFGTLLLGLGTYLLGFQWAGRRGGFVAILAFLCLPDPFFHFGLTPWFPVHWLLHTGPANLYGLPIGALALIAVLQGVRHRRALAVSFGLGLGAVLVFYKAQQFMIVMPLLLLYAVLVRPGWTTRARVSLWCASLLVVVAGLYLNWGRGVGPTLRHDAAYWQGYLNLLFTAQPGGTGVEFAIHPEQYPVALHYVGALGLLLLVSLGYALIALPIVTLLLALWHRLTAEDLIPWITVAIYAAFQLSYDVAWSPFGFYETMHRSVMWTYFVVVVWCAARLLGGVLRYPWGNFLLGTSKLALLGLVLLAYPIVAGRTVHAGVGPIQPQWVEMSLDRGHVDAARFLRARAGNLDVVQDLRADRWMMLGGLAERRSYIARGDGWNICTNLPTRKLALGRIAEVVELGKATTREAVLMFAQKTGVRWLLVHPGDMLSWPADLVNQPAFTSCGYRVYDLTRFTQTVP